MASSVFSTRIIAGVIIAILIVSGGIGIYYILQNDEGGPNNGDEKPPISLVEFDSSLVLHKSAYYKGEPLSFNLTATVNDTATIEQVTIEVYHPESSRTANQTVPIKQNVTSGNNLLGFEASPAFTEDGFVALTVGSYVITRYSVELSTNQTFSYDLSEDITVMDYSESDSISSVVWNEFSLVNVTYTYSEGAFVVSTLTNRTGSLILNTTTNLEAHPRLNYNSSMYQNDSVLVTIDGVVSTIDGNFSSAFIGTGNNLGQTSIQLNFTLGVNSTIELELAIPTRKTVLFAVVASNNWSAQSIDNLQFFLPKYYINQASSRFQAVFNLTIMPIHQVNFTSNAGSNLVKLRDEAINQTGNQLSLPLGDWDYVSGISPNNAGADILLVMTNKTMDYLGVVFSESGNTLNAAVHARGSLNTGNYRLHSSLADNLVQHEISHIFGAPDRFTDSSEPSIMTKSKLNDAPTDIIFGDFWLFLTYWLEQDIQTMFSNILMYH